MGSFFSVELERPVPGVETIVFPALARAADDLGQVARKLRVPGVWDFYDPGPDDELDAVDAPAKDRPRQSRRSLRARFWRMIGSLVLRGSPPAPPHEIRWHDAAEGVRALQAIGDHVRLHRDALARSAVDVDDALVQLDDLRAMLSKAQAAGVRFYLMLYT